MNRRQKIIVSVTGIFIVLLVLLGLTYAYFLTKITGNGNPTSISVTTVKLELVYGDGTTAILTSETPLMPSSTPIGTKDFTVTNNGDDSEYVVVFEDITVKYAADTVIDGEAVAAGTPTTFESNDFVYTLTCEVKDKNGITLSDKSCDGVENETFPMDGGIVLGNNIDKDDVHNYVLTLYYLDNGLDQSADMNKALNGKVNIKDIKSINPYSENTESLAYNIINNSMLNKNGTELLSAPETKIAEEISYSKTTSKIIEEEINLNGSKKWYYGTTYSDAQPWNGGNGVGPITECNDTLINKYISHTFYNVSYLVKNCKSNSIAVIELEETEYESSLLTARDDYGISYYYRGNVEDNYVNFAGMCWRIVRIAGDGSTKLILEDQYANCNDNEDVDGNDNKDYKYTGNWYIGTGNYGYELKNVDSDSSNEYIMSYLKPVTKAEQSMVKAFYDFQTTGKLKDYTSKLKSGTWCIADKAYKRSETFETYTYTPLEEYDYSSDMYYDAYARLTSGNVSGYQPTLKCYGTFMDKFENVASGETIITTESPMYVSTLTADEYVYAGAKYGITNYNYYLINDYSRGDNWVWLLSPFRFERSRDFVFAATTESYIGESVVHDSMYFRPVINLKSNITIAEGVGTIDRPYVIE